MTGGHVRNRSGGITKGKENADSDFLDQAIPTLGKSKGFGADRPGLESWCDPEQVASPLCTCFLISEMRTCELHRAVVRMKEVNHGKAHRNSSSAPSQEEH